MKHIQPPSIKQDRLKILCRSLFISLVFALTLGACSSYTPAERDLKPPQLTHQYSLYQDGTSDTRDRWWEGFQSQELNGLIELGLKNNLNIHQARSRMKQAKAILERVGGSTTPTIAGSLGTTRTQRPNIDGQNAFSLNLSASYELDMWGRVDSLIKAERLDFQATRADLETAAMSIAASVSETWLDIITIRREIDIIKTQVKSNESLLELLKLRYENALADVLDVLQQQEVLASSRAKIPLLEAREQVLLNNLSLLLGVPSGEGLVISQERLPEMPHFPTLGIPADLLAKRPDVRAAGLNLKSSDWDIATAKANRLPSTTLSGSYGYASSEFSTLFDNWIFSLGASLVSNFYDGGTKAAEVRRLEAAVEEDLAKYKYAVFKAFIEVENSIISEKKQAEYIALLEQQLSSAKYALTEAERQYTNGLKSFIPVITEIPKVQSLEKQIITEKASLLKYRIALFRALGGSWTTEWVSFDSESPDGKTGG